MRVATWNINSITARLPRVLSWLSTSGADVVCLQEIKCSTAAFPTADIESAGYRVVAHGTGRWNGVAILSRAEVTEVVFDLTGQPGYPATPDGEPVTEPRAVAATCGPVRLWSVYVPNGRDVDHPHYRYKLAWLSALRDTVAADAGGARPFAVLGDFNICPADTDVWSVEDYPGTTHLTQAERDALAELRTTGLSDVMPRALKYDVPFTYWDYRNLDFPKNRGMRIDLVYGNAAFAGAVSDAYVDREARKGKGPSDHAPVVVDLDV